MIFLITYWQYLHQILTIVNSIVSPAPGVYIYWSRYSRSLHTRLQQLGGCTGHIFSLMATSASQVAPPSLSWSVATELPLLHINNNNDNNNIDYNPIRSLSERSLHSGQSTQYKRLICKTGYMLEILPNGVVQGSQKRTNFGKFIILLLKCSAAQVFST